MEALLMFLADQTRLTEAADRLMILTEVMAPVAQTAILPVAGPGYPMTRFRCSTAFHIRFWRGGGVADAAYSPGPVDRAGPVWMASSPPRSAPGPDPVDWAAVRYQNPPTIPQPVLQTAHRRALKRIRKTWA
jgi:hypothetical protein